MSHAVPTPRKIVQARRRTGAVRQDLQLASAELGLANGALDRELPRDAKTGDVAWALGQNIIVERKVQEAADELKEVSELLQQEEAERERLEQELARQRRAS